MRAALRESGLGFEGIDFRLTGDNGEQYFFKEGALALARIDRKKKSEFEIWHPAECVGEVGAATVPMALTVALASFRKGYAKGRGLLCHFTNDDGKRLSLVLQGPQPGCN
jgi:3-oxoacyl-[acyl-carrier-protein] synthase-1